MFLAKYFRDQQNILMIPLNSSLVVKDSNYLLGMEILIFRFIFSGPKVQFSRKFAMLGAHFLC